jgi:molecular chaperone HtpG
MTAGATTHTFQTEVQQLLSMFAHALYPNRDIFLRELISNSADALQRMRIELLTNVEVVDRAADLEIRIASDAQAGTITIADTGIGMTAAEIVEHLGMIAPSRARALLEQLEREQHSPVIGQVEVGFYAVFAVADRVVVTSRSFQPHAHAVRWESEGGARYIVAPDDRTTRGTTVTIYLTDDAKAYARPEQIAQIVTQHADVVTFPMYLADVEVRRVTWRLNRRARVMERGRRRGQERVRLRRWFVLALGAAGLAAVGLAYSTRVRRHVMARGGRRWGEGAAATLTPEDEAIAARLLGWLEADR